MKMIITPFDKVGNLVFGIARADIRQMLNTKFYTMSKGFGDIIPSLDGYDSCDVYDELDIHLYYNKKDSLHLVEMGVHTKPIFEGINLLDGGLKDISTHLKEFDPNPQIDETSYTFYQLGLNLYSERADDEVELVMAFSKEYANFIKDIDLGELVNTIDIDRLTDLDV